VAEYNIGNKTKHETTIGAKLAFVQRIIISKTAIVGKDLIRENIGAINFPNEGRKQAVTQKPPAKMKDTKKESIALKRVAKYPRQKALSLNNLKHAFIVCEKDGNKYALPTTCAKTIQSKIRNENESKVQPPL
jgi:hypothetical protein